MLARAIELENTITQAQIDIIKAFSDLNIENTHFLTILNYLNEQHLQPLLNPNHDIYRAADPSLMEELYNKLTSLEFLQAIPRLGIEDEKLKKTLSTFIDIYFILVRSRYELKKWVECEIKKNQIVDFFFEIPDHVKLQAKLKSTMNLAQDPQAQLALINLKQDIHNATMVRNNIYDNIRKITTLNLEMHFNDLKEPYQEIQTLQVENKVILQNLHTSIQAIRDHLSDISKEEFQKLLTLMTMTLADTEKHIKITEESFAEIAKKIPHPIDVPEIDFKKFLEGSNFNYQRQIIDDKMQEVSANEVLLNNCVDKIKPITFHLNEDYESSKGFKDKLKSYASSLASFYGQDYANPSFLSKIKLAIGYILPSSYQDHPLMKEFIEKSHTNILPATLALAEFAAQCNNQTVADYNEEFKQLKDKKIASCSHKLSNLQLQHDKLLAAKLQLLNEKGNIIHEGQRTVNNIDNIFRRGLQQLLKNFETTIESFNQTCNDIKSECSEFDENEIKKLEADFNTIQIIKEQKEKEQREEQEKKARMTSHPSDRAQPPIVVPTSIEPAIDEPALDEPAINEPDAIPLVPRQMRNETTTTIRIPASVDQSTTRDLPAANFTVDKNIAHPFLERHFSKIVIVPTLAVLGVMVGMSLFLALAPFTFGISLLVGGLAGLGAGALLGFGAGTLVDRCINMAVTHAVEKKIVVPSLPETVTTDISSNANMYRTLEIRDKKAEKTSLYHRTPLINRKGKEPDLSSVNEERFDTGQSINEEDRERSVTITATTTRR
jgi:hypothetical protein